jgi:hypothetical protein
MPSANFIVTPFQLTALILSGLQLGSTLNPGVVDIQYLCAHQGYNSVQLSILEWLISSICVHLEGVTQVNCSKREVHVHHDHHQGQADGRANFRCVSTLVDLEIWAHSLIP